MHSSLSLLIFFSALLPFLEQQGVLPGISCILTAYDPPNFVLFHFSSDFFFSSLFKLFHSLSYVLRVHPVIQNSFFSSNVRGDVVMFFYYCYHYKCCYTVLSCDSLCSFSMHSCTSIAATSKLCFSTVSPTPCLSYHLLFILFRQHDYIIQLLPYYRYTIPSGTLYLCPFLFLLHSVQFSSFSSSIKFTVVCSNSTLPTCLRKCVFLWM